MHWDFIVRKKSNYINGVFQNNRLQSFYRLTPSIKFKQNHAGAKQSEIFAVKTTYSITLIEKQGPSLWNAVLSC